MSIEIQVRDLGQDDLEPLLALYRHLHEHDDPLPDRVQVEEIWERIVRDPSQIYLGAFVDVGTLSPRATRQ
jgi:hypothetical protein